MKETAILFVDEQLFGDRREHEYDCECEDGKAVGTLADKDDRSAPKVIEITYPKMEDILKDEEAMEQVRRYRGLDHGCQINYGDIMLKFGKITRR